MGVHKKPGMNTSRATVNCGLICLWKGRERGTSSAWLSPGQVRGRRRLIPDIKADLQEILAEPPPPTQSRDQLSKFSFCKKQNLHVLV